MRFILGMGMEILSNPPTSPPVVVSFIILNYYETGAPIIDVKHTFFFSLQEDKDFHCYIFVHRATFTSFLLESLLCHYSTPCLAIMSM